jgi:nicotinamidase-related amidase
VIDLQYATTGEAPMPFPQALEYHPLNCGEAAWTATEKIQLLIKEFRSLSLPVIYPHVVPRKQRNPNQRMPMAGEFNPRHWEIVECIAQRDGDLVVPKTGPSAFSGTPLVSHLVKLGVDTLVLTGNTTSGCLRASVIDSYALSYKALVVSDAVYDRSPISHVVNLFDIHHKYAEVVDAATAVEKGRAGVR